ncbi:MAG TPA: hypothetical protein VHM91_13575, partial [Verrucomicrobiales bacterium]|nr:hypothetical protein [Verrucomicrobiales bacterium]
NDAKAWVQSGRTTWKALAGMIKQVEKATGNQYLHGYTEDADTAQNHTDGADSAQNQTAITEAFSELVQVHATGQGRAGKAADGAVAAAARETRMDARARLQDAKALGVAPALMERLAATREWLQTVVGKAIRLHRARRKAQAEGRSFAIDEFLNDSVGIPKEDGIPNKEAQPPAGAMEETQTNPHGTARHRTAHRRRTGSGNHLLQPQTLRALSLGRETLPQQTRRMGTRRGHRTGGNFAGCHTARIACGRGERIGHDVAAVRIRQGHHRQARRIQRCAACTA